MKETLANAAVRLRIATRKACMGNEGGKRKNTLSLETKILFLIRDMPRTPNDLTDILALKKSNLAALASRMEQAELIERHKLDFKRDTAYHITQTGIEYLDARLNATEESFAAFVSGEKEYAEAYEVLDAAVRLLSFI